MDNMNDNKGGKRDEIRKLLEEGKTVREICKALGVSATTVCRVRKELGLTTRTGTRRAERRKEERKEREDEKEELKRRVKELEEALKRKERENAIHWAVREELESSRLFWLIVSIIELGAIIGLCVWLRVWTWV